MSKPPAGLRHKTIDIPTNSIGTVGRRSDATGDPSGDPELSTLLAARKGSSPLSSVDRSQPTCATELDRLYCSLNKVTSKSHPRTARLLVSGTRNTAQKVIEEAGEVALEPVKHRPGGVVRESTDLFYHLVVLWRRAGVEAGEIWNEIQRRADVLGIAEKRPKPSPRNPSPSRD